MPRNDEWSPDRYLFAYARRIWQWSPERHAVVEAASKSAGHKLKRRCAKCENIFPKGEVVADHIVPVIDPVKGFETWDIYYKRLFTTRDNLQALCVNCHKNKTEEENKCRRSSKKN